MGVAPRVAEDLDGDAEDLAACGGSGEATPVATTEAVMPKSYRFDPKTIEVDAGAIVTWRNQDNFTHTGEVAGMGDALTAYAGVP